MAVVQRAFQETERKYTTKTSHLDFGESRLGQIPPFRKENQQLTKNLPKKPYLGLRFSELIKNRRNAPFPDHVPPLIESHQEKLEPQEGVLYSRGISSPFLSSFGY